MPANQYDSQPEMQIDETKNYTAIIEMENGNEIEIELFAKEVPVTVNNFVFLSREGYYDGVTFHRVIPGFMAQGGDPTGTGAGGPGYSFENEFSPIRPDPILKSPDPVITASAEPVALIDAREEEPFTSISIVS